MKEFLIDIIAKTWFIWAPICAGYLRAKRYR